MTGSILVVDDDEVMREVLSLLLGEAGCEVLSAESGDAALTLLSTLPSGRLPALLLVDMQMPGLSSAALAVRLRAACPATRLIAMSGSRRGAEDAAAYDAFLLKPFTAAGFNAVAHAGRPLIVNCDRQEPQNAAHAGEVLDSAVFDKLAAVMGPAQLPQLYNMFLDDASARIDRMRTFSVARDEASFVREAHTLKGGCGMLGAMELQALAASAEAGGLAASILLEDFQSAIARVRSILEQHSSLRT